VLERFFRKNQVILFVAIAIGCSITILIAKPPLRNYVPIVWGIYGFALHSVLWVITWMKLNKKLMSDYKPLLKEDRISHFMMKHSFTKKEYPRVNTLQLYSNKTLMGKVDETTRKQILFYKTNFQLAFIAFLLFGAFGLLTVMLRSPLF
jgi:hypothetical protein